MEERKSFADAIKAYNATQSADALQNLGKAVTLAVLKKVINAGASAVEKPERDRGREKVSSTWHGKVMMDLRRGLYQNDAQNVRLANALDGATELHYTPDGNIVSVVVDAELENAIPSLLDYAVQDGADLVQDAIVAILEETAKQAERADGVGVDLERAYSIRRLRKKVLIKDADAVGAWETVETTPIQEIYKVVRRSIENNRSVQVANGKYCYLDDIQTDTETGTEEKVYRRLPKYADYGADTSDTVRGRAERTEYGAPVMAIQGGTYTADETTADETEITISALGLSAREMQVLRYRQRGYGERAIATALHISRGNVFNLTKRIREKAERAGLSPTK